MLLLSYHHHCSCIKFIVIIIKLIYFIKFYVLYLDKYSSKFSLFCQFRSYNFMTCSKVWNKSCGQVSQFALTWNQQYRQLITSPGSLDTFNCQKLLLELLKLSNTSSFHKVYKCITGQSEPALH